MAYKTISLDAILPAPLFLRVHEPEADHIVELAGDLAENGMDTPIVVIDNGDDTYTLNDGSRRYTAAMYLDGKGQSIKDVTSGEVPVRVIGSIADWSEEDQLANQMRLNAHVLETSPKEYYQACMKLAATGMSAKQIGEKINKSSAVVGSWLKSLNVPENYKTLVMNGDISLANAKVIADNKRFLDEDLLTDLIDPAKEKTNEDFLAQVTELVNEVKEKRKGESTDEAPAGFTLTPVLLKKDGLEDTLSRAMAQAEEVPTDYNNGFLDAMKTIFQIDDASADRRKAEYDKKEADKKANAKKRAEEKLVKSLGVNAAEFIAEHGQEAFNDLIAKASEMKEETTEA